VTSLITARWSGEMTVVSMGRAAAGNVRGCERLVFVEASRGEIDRVLAAILAKDTSRRTRSCGDTAS
jgi:hypothetical protein